ncbi:C-C chemokine receptor type 4 [Chanos chanos]|uniref:C-C chemokine receptor type 4 n=1 Tax=Chanos chanos TaxID=29144 RepID=A0A6J2VZQ3_CHACN|nr:C-C chemokine receptor type 4-like [Chanos chanos]
MTDVCLVNLSLADLLLVCSLPFLADHARRGWVFGELMCKLVLSIYYIGFYSGIFFITMMGVDRYLAIVHAIHAMRVRTRTYGILASIVIWIVSVLASFPETIFLKVKHYKGNSSVCHSFYGGEEDGNRTARAGGIVKMNVLGFIIPLIIMVFCYSMILRRVAMSRSTKKRAMRLIVLVMVVFLCCWAPYNIISFLKSLELFGFIGECEPSRAIHSCLQITECIAYFHSCVNPLLYVFVGEKFKRHLFRLLNKGPCMKVQFMKNYLSPTIGSVYSQTTSVDERSTGL